MTLLLLGSCTRTVYVPVASSRVIVDTVVGLSADSAMIRALFECDSSGRVLIRELSQLKGRNSNQSFLFENNELNLETRWQTKLIERLIEVKDTVTVVQERKIVTQKAFIPKFFWGCFAFSLLTLGWIVFKIIR